MGTNPNKKKAATRANAGLRPDQAAEVRTSTGSLDINKRAVAIDERYLQGCPPPLYRSAY
jgi:hypothetical protein